MTRFYSQPPRDVEWPWYLATYNWTRDQRRYLERHRVRHVLIDTGIHMFKDPGRRDYPPGWMVRGVKVYREITDMGLPAWIIVPDYPDDYEHRSLWEDENRTNIERTLDNILEALDRYPDVEWMIPLQGWIDDPGSLLYAIDLYREHGVPLNRVAVANLCTTNKCWVIRRSVEIVRYYLRDAWIHVFGPKADCVKPVLRYIDSWDSLAWIREPGSSNRERWTRWIKRHVR